MSTKVGYQSWALSIDAQGHALWLSPLKVALRSQRAFVSPATPPVAFVKPCLGHFQDLIRHQ